MSVKLELIACFSKDIAAVCENEHLGRTCNGIPLSIITVCILSDCCAVCLIDHEFCVRDLGLSCDLILRDLYGRHFVGHCYRIVCLLLEISSALAYIEVALCIELEEYILCRQIALGSLCLCELIFNIHNEFVFCGCASVRICCDSFCHGSIVCGVVYAELCTVYSSAEVIDLIDRDAECLESVHRSEQDLVCIVGIFTARCLSHSILTVVEVAYLAVGDRESQSSLDLVVSGSSFCLGNGIFAVRKLKALDFIGLGRCPCNIYRLVSRFQRKLSACNKVAVHVGLCKLYDRLIGNDLCIAYNNCISIIVCVEVAFACICVEAVLCAVSRNDLSVLYRELKHRSDNSVLYAVLLKVSACLVIGISSFSEVVSTVCKLYCLGLAGH